MDFKTSLRYILHKLERLTTSMENESPSEQQHSNPLEILVDDYDPDYRRFNIRLVVNGVTVSFGHLNPRSGVCTFPYAPISALTFNIPRFRQLAKISKFHPDLDILLRWIDSSYLFDSFTAFKKECRDEWDSTLTGNTKTSSDTEVHKLVEMNAIRQVGPEEVDRILLSAPAFKVEKSDGKSARFVYNGKRFDAVLEKVVKWKKIEIPQMPSLSIRGALRQILRGWKCISANDFTSFFFQIPIHPSLGNLLGLSVEINNKKSHYKMKGLPMGITFSPAVAQHIGLFLKQYIKEITTDIDFDMVIWIDNILVLTNSDDDNKKIREKFDALIGELNIIAKKWEFPDDDGTITALGMEINLQQQRVRPAKKSIEKMNKAFDELCSTATPRSFFTFQGLIMWMSYMGTIPLCFMDDFMKIVRTQSKWLATFTTATDTVPWFDRRPDLDNDQLRNICGDVRNLCLNIIVQGPLHSLPPAIISHTDASTEALAGISLDNKLVYCLPCKINHRLIHVSEILAGALQSVLMRHLFPFVWPALPWL